MAELACRHVWKLDKKFGIAEKDLEAAENEVCDATYEYSPGGSDAGIL